MHRHNEPFAAAIGSKEREGLCMGGIFIFVAVVAVNLMLLLFTSLIGVVLMDLSLIVTLLIVVYENQLKLLYGGAPEPDLSRREAAAGGAIQRGI
ncbi:hypothetical protein [Paenibacillus validus]|uniref:hypothetical protein n=1 Tax=Paenibacillus validus TaxID=44253 RepID=UPI003D2A3B91